MTMKADVAEYAGPGIYFAASPEAAANHTAHYHDVILVCKVVLGRVKSINAPDDYSWKIWQFFGQYDSVRITSRRGHEYAVYDPSRIKSIKLHSGRLIPDDSVLGSVVLAVVAVYVVLWIADPSFMRSLHSMLLSLSLFACVCGSAFCCQKARM